MHKSYLPHQLNIVNQIKYYCCKKYVNRSFVRSLEIRMIQKEKKKRKEEEGGHREKTPNKLWWCIGSREATRTINYVVFGFKFHTFMKTWHVLNLMRFPFRIQCLLFCRAPSVIIFSLFFSSCSHESQTYRMNLFNQCQWYRHHRKSLCKGRLNSKWNRIFHRLFKFRQGASR